MHHIRRSHAYRHWLLFRRTALAEYHHLLDLPPRQLIIRILILHMTVFFVLAVVLDELPAWHQSATIEVVISIGLIVWAERRWPLDVLTTTLHDIDRRINQLDATWCGVRVRLTGPIQTPQGHTLLPTGAQGTIIEVRLDPGAPFAVRFDGSEIPVAPRLEKLAIVAGVD